MVCSPRFQFIRGDVCDAEHVARVMREVDIVVHMAAETHVTRSIYDTALFFHAAVLGTMCVADAAVQQGERIERFIHFSTSEVYGSCRDDRETMDEEHPLEPCSPYAGAKAGADRLVYSYWKTYGLPVVIVRPFNNYGPRQHVEKLVPRFVTSALLREPLTLHGTGCSSRDWVYVEDTCRALDILLHAPSAGVNGEVFNIGTGVAGTVRSVAESVLGLLQRSEELIVRVDDRPGQVRRHRADAGKLKRLFGWEPRTEITEGLARTIAWYRDNERFWRPQRHEDRRVPVA
jgi:dTDP-glucose 4,6-dehydratase